VYGGPKGTKLGLPTQKKKEVIRRLFSHKRDVLWKTIGSGDNMVPKLE
jgi:hypothetical protein